MTDFPFEVDLQALKGQIAVTLTEYGSKHKRNKRNAIWVSIISACASSAASAALGLSKFWVQFSNFLQMFALVVSASVAGIVAWDALCRHKSLWVMSSMGERNLQSLTQDIAHAEATKSVTPELLKIFYGRYRAIVGDVDRAWDQMRATH